MESLGGHMKIFLGSSTEAKGAMVEVASWLEDEGRHAVLRWDAPGVFTPDHGVFEELLRLAAEVDGALLIFSEDDRTWKRGEQLSTTRDNILFEYGMFVGALGRDSVRRVVVGRPDPATDLLGLHAIRLPPNDDRDADREAREQARRQVLAWARRLSPAYLKRLGFDLAKHLARNQQTPVRDILLSVAPAFLSRNRSQEIRAMCSDKGVLGGSYYGRQFAWVEEPGASERRLRRIFVRAGGAGSCEGFSKGEVEGILLHLDRRSEAILARWVYESDSRLGGTYSSDLGFAIFGESWFVHWGLEAGTFHDAESAAGADDGFGNLLRRRWEDLWDHSFEFDPDLVDKLRRCSEATRGGRTP